MTSTRIHGQYAKAREVDKKYAEAARAYEFAKEFDSAIRYSEYRLSQMTTVYNAPIVLLTRVYLDYLQQPDDAVRIVKKQNSVDGAKMVAR